MGFWSFLLLVILILAGVMLYHRLQTMEREIRAELEKKDAEGQQDLSQEPRPSLSESLEQVAQVDSKSTGIESQLLEEIMSDPGLMQTVLYKRISGQSTKVLQGTLRKMDQNGKIRRVKAKGSYQVFPS